MYPIEWFLSTKFILPGPNTFYFIVSRYQWHSNVFICDVYPGVCPICFGKKRALPIVELAGNRILPEECEMHAYLNVMMIGIYTHYIRGDGFIYSKRHSFFSLSSLKKWWKKMSCSRENAPPAGLSSPSWRAFSLYITQFSEREREREELYTQEKKLDSFWLLWHDEFLPFYLFADVTASRISHERI